MLFMSACAVAALACGWNGFENSVRFSLGTTDRERTRLPPLPFDAGGAKQGAAGTLRGAYDDGPVSGKQRAGEADRLWDDSVSAVNGGELTKARGLLRDYVERTEPALWVDAWEQPANIEARRSSALDHLDALEALDRGSSSENVRQYILARRAYDGWLAETTVSPHERYNYRWFIPEKKEEEEERIARRDAERAAGMKLWARDVEPPLSALARDPNLADNAAYLRAVGIYRAGQPGDAVEAFLKVAAKYPQSEKREAALLMAGRAAMQSSRVYLGGGQTATSEDPCRGPECRDEAWERARENFTRLIREYPRGRYAADARGWLAYLKLRVGDVGGALVEYYRLLGDAQDAEGQGLALRSLRLARGGASDDDMRVVEAELEDEPQAALAYAYHNIYNYAFGYYLRTPEIAEENPYDGGQQWAENSRWLEERGGALRGRAERQELRRVAAFATRLMRRYPRAQVGGAFAVRLAEANLELGETGSALETSRRALASGVAGGERAQALWVKGVSEYRLRDYAAARKTLAQLADEFPAGDLAEGTRRLIAMAAEDAGDLAGALEQYLALGYDSDVAYFVDVLMTPDQLASFVEGRANSPRRDELLYALGLRFMRAGRYAEARGAFSRVRTMTGSYDYGDSYYGFYDSECCRPGMKHPKLHFRRTFWDDYGDYAPRTPANPSQDTGVYADWVLRDVKTLDDLERLRNEVERAEGDEAKAEAVYQLASYLYEGGSLAFYNPAAWRGMRAEMLRELNESNYRSPNEAEIVWRYAQEHEAVARALALYLEVVRLYPRTRAARDSLYTAILCHQRLMNFNGYWRERYDQGLHAGGRVVGLADLRREYPQYRLPRAGEWRPSTRTVDGEAAWPQPPKPKPLTGVEHVRRKVRRAELRVAQAWELFGEVADGRARRWSLLILVSLGILIVLRATRRSRALLLELFARSMRRGARTPEVLPARASSYAAQEPFTAGARVRSSARGAGRALWQVLLDERGRATLAINLITHGLLTALLYALAWALRAG